MAPPGTPSRGNGPQPKIRLGDSGMSSAAPAIVQQIYGPAKELDVIALDPGLERLTGLTSP